MGKILYGHDGILNFLHHEPVFALLPGHIDLQKNVHIHLFFCCFRFNLPGQAQGVHGMDHHRVADHLADLVALKMADHMPADVLGQFRFLGQDLLDLILSKVPGSCSICLLQHGNRFCLAHGDQSDFLRSPARPDTCCIDGFPYLIQIFFYHLLVPPCRP